MFVRRRFQKLSRPRDAMRGRTGGERGRGLVITLLGSEGDGFPWKSLQKAVIQGEDGRLRYGIRFLGQFQNPTRATSDKSQTEMGDKRDTAARRTAPGSRPACRPTGSVVATLDPERSGSVSWW